MSTTYDIDFNFTTPNEIKELHHLQEEGWSLQAFLGAFSTDNHRQSIPVWFNEDFINISRYYRIAYTPMYIVYIADVMHGGQRTVLSIGERSPQVGLGTALTFKEDGEWKNNSNLHPGPDSISLLNDSAVNSRPLMVGLATPHANGGYTPFCAFELAPQESITMTPNNTVVMMAVKEGLQSGTVVSTAASPGVKFVLRSSQNPVDLKIEQGSNAIVGADGSIVDTFPSTTSLNILLME